MWDSGFGNCAGCGVHADRDILGRCDRCFRRGIEVRHGWFIERGVENPYDPEGSTAHVRDIKARRLDPQTKKMVYDQPPKTYFFPKG